jgi:sulfur oxidation c-type cytochrome SoxX
VAEETTKDAGATFYKVKTLNWWFFVSVVVLTASYFWSVWDDYDRPWRKYQIDFMDLEKETAVRQGQAAYRAAGGDPEFDRLDAEVERRKKALEAAREQGAELEKAYRAAQLNFNQVNARMKKAKAIYEAERFKYEEKAYDIAESEGRGGKEGEAGAGGGPIDAFIENKIPDPNLRDAFVDFNKLKRDYLDLDDKNKAAEAEMGTAKAELDRFNSLAGDVQAEIDTKEREVNRLEKRADSNDRRRGFTKFRNSIFVNFMAPTIAPKKIVVNEILDDVNFTRIPKVDMCITCHLATDRNKDYPPGNSHVTWDGKGSSPAFRSHSKPELFCTSLSPHGQERFGCSGCHGGANQRLDFAKTFHTPTNGEEREIWEDDSELKWHPVHEWDYPMLSSEFIDASCYKCHKSEVHIPGAAKWNRGRDLVAKLGCFGCHKMAPMEGERRVAPPLGHLVSKLQSLDWMLKWVDNPASFRPTTKMPAYFHLENRADEPGRAEAEVTALVTYVLSLNTPQELDKYPQNGDAERGKQIFGGDSGGKGCLACHNIDEFKNADVGEQRHAPDLSGVGSKVTADWLYTWVRDPKRLFPETNMPSLRLTDQEAADVVAYLMTKKNALFDSATYAKPASDAPFEQILLEKLTEQKTDDDAKKQIAQMSGLEKRRKAGEYLLNHYGCFGCHLIPGYEDAKPIGTELNGWGSKHADRLDFGAVEMDWKAEGKFNRETWVKQKLSNTRFYDREKDKRPFEKLKMPQFALLKGPDVDQAGAPDPNAADREAVMTYVMSLVKDNTLASIQHTLSPSQEAVERGRRLVRDKNCYGCHIIQGEGGEIRKFQGEEGRAYFPPILDGQGARTQPDWLNRFLADPVMGAGRGAKAFLRPWMKARMPTFGFTQEQLNDLVAFFAQEEVFQTADDHALWDTCAEKFRKDFPAYDEKSMRQADATKQQLYQLLVARQYKRQGGRFLHETDFPFLTRPASLTGNDVKRARNLFENKGQCILCHMPEGRIPQGKTEADLAPDLTNARTRLAPKWILHWLEGPNAYQPGTKMPAFWTKENGVRPSIDEAIGDGDKEMQLLRDYLFSDDFPKDYHEIASKVTSK